MMGRFAIPEMPENPTQVEVGENLYFYHCMPCHGDQGQGLTDEFRAAWVEDHQNCWARGCHTGRPDEEGFPIPKVVPPVVASQIVAHFPAAERLYDYLSSQHPPQNPGVLEVDEYWALTAFLWFKNGQLPPGVELAPAVDDSPSFETEAQPEESSEPQVPSHAELGVDSVSGSGFPWLWLISLALILAIFLLVFIWRRKKFNHSASNAVDIKE